MSDSALILHVDRKPITRVEIARSFSYKLNVAQYESRDFFCSQKAECLIEDADEVSADLNEFCMDQVMAAVKEYVAEMRRRKTA